VSRIRPVASAAVVAAAALVPAGTAHARPADLQAHAAKKTTITMSGSTSVYPLLTKLIPAFQKKYPNQYVFKVAQGGSDVGIQDVSKGRVSIGSSSRDIEDGDPGGLTFNKIARDGVCVVTNTANPIANLSQQQVQDIFSGKTRRWDDVQGASITGPIDLVVRTNASGTQDAFKNIFMGPDLNVAPSASQKTSNGLVQTGIRTDKQAIGYVDFKFTGGTHAVPYKGIGCTLANAKSGQYPGIRNFWFVTRGAPTGAVKKFVDWTRSPSVQSSIVAKDWVAYK
jgi:phosphate transport system substrate-binding protein